MRVYFASDLHGSRRCWLKFLASAGYYKADVVIVGGDITGKFLVPVVRQADGGVAATLHGVERRARSEEELAKLLNLIADSGGYGVVVEPDELDQLGERGIAELLDRLIGERLEEWVRLADERLNGVRCLVSGGNDDGFWVDDVLRTSARIEVPEGRVVELGEGFELLGLGYANETPWHCPRDIPEAELRERIDAVAAQASDLGKTIFDIHVPPHDSGLDSAPELDENFEMVMIGAGEPHIVPVGSTAVRSAIDELQPLLGLHGHIHESRGIELLGRTTVANPGSQYAEGLLNGVLVDLHKRKGVVRARLVSG